MRNIPAKIQTLLESGEGIEPIMLVGIFWVFGRETFYADKNIGGIGGIIVSFDALETVTRVDGSGSSTQFSFTLNDANGIIKDFMDTHDATVCEVKAYQLFNEGNIQDRIMLYEGHIATPIEWDEGTRNIKITTVTRKISKDVGFALDDSGVSVFHQDLIGKAWPAVFGSPRLTPTLLLNEVPTGTTTIAFGVADKDLSDQKIDDLNKQKNDMNDLLIGTGVFVSEESGFDPVTGLSYSTDADFKAAQDAAIAWAQSMEQKIQGIEDQIANESSKAREDTVKFKKTNYIIDGYRFPQNMSLICKINERVFKLIFQGGAIPENPEEACPVNVSIHGIPLEYRRNDTKDDNDSFFQAGSRVELLSDLPGGYNYVASITPGLVEGVYAYRTFNGVRKLTRVPSKYYSIRTEPFASGLAATYIVFKYPLSNITYRENTKVTNRDDYLQKIDSGHAKANPTFLNDEIDWENEIFVNFVSTIGPNVASIMMWIIQHFTNYGIDYASFFRVHDYVINYPANFCLTEMISADQLLQDIAFQSRCAIWLKNGVYYIKYLPKENDTTSTITENDIVSKSFRVISTSTDEIITKINAKWRPDYIQPERTAIIRMNDGKYGTIVEDQSYYIYSDYHQVVKSATFWLIRRSNVWKKITCDLLVHKLDIETLDDVTLDLTNNYVSNGPIDCQVESAEYNSDENIITVELWTPVRLGEMTAYPWARPADLPARQLIPLFNPITISGGPSKTDTPNVPKYNALSNPADTSTNTVPAFEEDPAHNTLGYIRTKQNGTPASNGDRMPSDRGDRFSQVPIYSPNYQYGNPSNYPIKKDPAFVTEQPVDNKKKLNSICPGRVVSGSGKVWTIEIFPNGLSGKGETIKAAEAHQATTLKGIEGSWVTCFRLVDEDGRLTYTFYVEDTAAFPVKMDNTTTGKIYTRGSAGTGISFPIHQLYIDKDDHIPAETWSICTRLWNGTAFIYETQVPIWLKD